MDFQRHLNLCDKRRSLKKTKNSSPEEAAQYRDINSLVRKKMREARENWINNQCENMEKGMEKGNSKHDYAILKKLTKTQQNTLPVIEDTSGELLTESSAVLNRRTQRCQELYNYPIQPDDSLIDKGLTPRESSALPVLKEEVVEAIHSLQKGKSSRADSIPTELFKHGGDELVTVVTINFSADLGNKTVA
jgi:hypothetical protein